MSVARPVELRANSVSTAIRTGQAAQLAEFQVRNAIEAAFDAQAVAACHAAMACLRRTAMMNAREPATRRVFATATALSRMSLQMTRAIDQQRGVVRKSRPATPADPLAAALAAVSGQFNRMQSGAPASPAHRTAAAAQVHPNKAVALPPAAATGTQHPPAPRTSP
jgi:hypothetical protein